MKFGNIVICVLTDADQWVPVPPAEVPEWIKGNPELLGMLLVGQEVQDGNGPWYRAVKLDDSSLLAPATPKPRVLHDGIELPNG